MNIPVILFGALAAATIAVSAWCKILSRNEDGYLHTGEASASAVAKQQQLGAQINKAEGMRRMLIWATTLWGVITVCLFLWQQWNSSSGISS